MNHLHRACLRAVSLLIAGLLCMHAGVLAKTEAKTVPAMEAEPRLALVVGNAAYQNAPLRNPLNDAADIAGALRAIGFKVTLVTNANQQTMKQALREFGHGLKRGGVGLFYYAGHGVQSKGRNFLIPVGVNITAEAELEDQSVDANLVLSYMEEAENRVNIVILDACRNNPFAQKFRSMSRGLAQMDAARGSFLAFATAPGAVASDGEGRNGLYTERLLRSLKQGDPDIDKVFRRVAADVSTITKGKQVPWVASSLTGDFSFRAAAPQAAARVPAASPPAAVDASHEAELAFWESIKDSSNPQELRAYLQQFPNGVFAPLARLRSGASTPAQQAEVFVTPPVNAKEEQRLAADAGYVTPRKSEVGFAALEEARITARKNAELNAEGWRASLYRDFVLVSRSDASQRADCPQGDGWASIDLVSPDKKKVVQIKCSTISTSMGCLLVADFKTKSYAREDGVCQPTSRVPYPLPWLSR